MSFSTVPVRSNGDTVTASWWNTLRTQGIAVEASILDPNPTRIQKFTSGSGTYNPTYLFLIATGSATAAATYTNNSVTFTVTETIASGTILAATGSSIPSDSGTLTKTAGTGDATLTFSRYWSPVYLKVHVVGGGAGGCGSADATSNGGLGGAGANTTFGSSFLTAAGAATQAANSQGGLGGAPSALPSGVFGHLMTGTGGHGTLSHQAGGASFFLSVNGGAGPFGGCGTSNGVTTGGSAPANSGGGGGGAVYWGTGYNGSSGGSGAYIYAFIRASVLVTGSPNPYTFSYSVGAGGTAGTAGSGASAAAGGAGGSGIIIVEEYYQ